MGSELTAAQVAERLNVGRSTVNLWCRQGRFPGARVEESPVGDYWLIPESDLKNFEKPDLGRPPKAKNNDTAEPVEIRPQLDQSFREAKEAEEASQKKVTKKAGKK